MRYPNNKKYIKKAWPILNTKNILIFVLGILLGLFINDVFANDYYWKVTEVVDGDTIRVSIPELPSELHTTIRVIGVDTPEKGRKAKCEYENNLGLQATEYSKLLLNQGHVIKFSNIKWDKYGGRILAVVKIDDKILADELIKAHLAREYHGEKKKSWCHENR